MLCVRRITLREIRLPLKEPFRISSGVSTERRICLLELESADGGGPTGWSECAPATGRSRPTGTVPPSRSPLVGETMNSWHEPTVDVEHAPAVAFAITGWAFPPAYEVEM